jgi:hypothetical protein
MKRKVLSTILGAAGIFGLVATSHAQGRVYFDNYNATPYYPIVYSGTDDPAGSEAYAELGYALGTTTTGFTLIPSSTTEVNSATPGYFQGGIVLIPGYTSGPVSFEILSWVGTSYASATYTGSINWTEPSIAVSPARAGFFSHLPGDIVLTPTPEPTTLALAGLGGLASLVAFRRKNA